MSRHFPILRPAKVLKALSEGFQLRQSFRRGGVQHCQHAFDMQSQDGPLRIAKDDERDLPGRKILLVPDIFVRRDYCLKTGQFRLPEQVAIRKSVPSLLDRFRDLVPGR